MIYKVKKYSIMLIALTFLIITFIPNIYASSISMNAYTTLEIGGTTTITISGSDAIGKFNISSSNTGVVTLNKSSVFIDGSDTVIATAKAGGTATITLTPDDVSNSSGTADITSTIGSKSITIKVNTPVVNTPTTPTTPTTTKSSNANLKRLVPNYEGLSPNFNSAVTKYSLTVPSTATSLGLTVGVEQSGAKYYISGEDNLKMGDNTVSITVTAPDGTKKVYTIIVTKADDVAKANARLSNIVIDGKTLSPAFSAENFEYDIEKVASDVEKLTVLAYAQSENAKVEITGNDKLVEGDNIIKVKVTAVDGTTTKEYIIKVKKDAKPVDEVVNIYPEDNSLQDTTPSKFSNIMRSLWMYLQTYWLMLSLLVVCLFELWQIIYLYKKVNKSEKTEVIDNNDIVNEGDNTPKTRRRNIDLDNKNGVLETSNNKEEAIEDISDELVDNSNEENIEVDDETDNFEDSIDEEDK